MDIFNNLLKLITREAEGIIKPNIREGEGINRKKVYLEQFKANFFDEEENPLLHSTHDKEEGLSKNYIYYALLIFYK